MGRGQGSGFGSWELGVVELGFRGGGVWWLLAAEVVFEREDAFFEEVPAGER